MATIAVTHPTPYDKPTTSTFVLSPSREFIRPAPKISRTSFAPPSKAKPSAPIHAKSIRILNMPRCDSLFPLRDSMDDGPRGVVFGERLIMPPAQFVINSTQSTELE